MDEMRHVRKHKRRCKRNSDNLVYEIASKADSYVGFSNQTTYN